MTNNIEKIIQQECHTDNKVTNWDYVYTQQFSDGEYPMYKCRCCGIGRYGTKIITTKEV